MRLYLEVEIGLGLYLCTTCTTQGEGWQEICLNDQPISVLFDQTSQRADVKALLSAVHVVDYKNTSQQLEASVL